MNPPCADKKEVAKHSRRTRNDPSRSCGVISPRLFPLWLALFTCVFVFALPIGMIKKSESDAADCCFFLPSIQFSSALETTTELFVDTTQPPTTAPNESDDGTRIGDVVLTTEDGLGRVTIEVLIALAITVSFLFPIAFDQFMMLNTAARYNGRKVDVVSSDEGGGGGGGGGAAMVGPKGVKTNTVNGAPAPPFLPIGISSSVHVGGFPLDGPREYLIYTKVTKKQLDRLANNPSSKKSKSKRNELEEEIEDELLDLGPKPFAHQLTFPSHEVLSGGANGNAPVKALAPLVAHPPLIRTRHRRVDPSFAESVLCCLDEGMDVDLPPIPVGEVECLEKANGGGAGGSGGKKGASTTNAASGKGPAATDEEMVYQQPQLTSIVPPSPTVKSRSSPTIAPSASPATVAIEIDDDLLLGPSPVTAKTKKKAVKKKSAAVDVEL